MWRDQFRLIELTQNMRQRGDVVYSSLLNRVRTGSQTSDDDMSLLRTHLTSGIHNPIDLDQVPFEDALRLLPLKEQVNLYNQHCLEKLSTTTTIYEFSADHTILESSKQAVGVVSHNSVPEALITPDDNECAVKQLSWCSLCRKIMCEDGLVNGARGVVVKFTWPNGESD